MCTRGIQFTEAASRLSNEVKKKLIERLADITYAAAFYRAPWKTGKLASSIVKQVSRDEASVEALAPYAAFVVKGTAPHEIRPVNASVLAFEAGGRMVFTPLVRHPGTKPNPFMEKAAEDTRSKAREVFDDLWLELIG